MSNRFVQAGVLLLPLLAANATLAAQETALLDYEFKIRGGYTMGNLSSDLRAERMMGIAIGTFFPLGKGRLIADLGFETFPGKDFDNMPTSGTFYYNPASPSSTYLAQQVRLAISSGSYGSADMRKNRLQGFNLRVGYASRLSSVWDWQAGLVLENYTATEEVSGTLYPITTATATTGIPNTSASGKPYYETLAFTCQKSRLGLGAFAGVSTMLTDEVSLEFNLRSVSYTQLRYMPFTYTGLPATTHETMRRGFTLEVSLGMKL